MRFTTLLKLAVVGVAAAYAAGCTGGASSAGSATGLGTNTGANNNTGGGTTGSGTGSVSVTDAASDQITSFDVNVNAIDLTREDGAVVHALPQTARVDFAELVNESQLLSAFSLLAGTYKSVAITFDLSASGNPQVLIAGSTTPATLLDSSGNQISGPVTETIQFGNQNPLIVTPGLHKDIALDFDLDSSCTIDATANTVQLGNVIQASQNAVAPKVNQVFGTLVGVDTTAQVASITLNWPLALQPGPGLAIQLTSSTKYFVDGASGTLATFAAKVAGSGVLAQGGFNGTATFTATSVECWTPEDLVEGHVISRDQAGNLTVLGWGEAAGSGSRTYNATWSVNATTTKVYQRPLPAATAAPGTASDQTFVAVGQRICARGKLSGQAIDSTVAGGHVVLEETGIFGYADSALSGSTLAMNVARFGRRPVGLFNFTVGTTVTADPTNFLVNVSTLAGSLGSVGKGTPLAVRGILTPITTPTGQANANALTVVDRTDVASLLSVGWPLTTSTPFVTASGSEIALSLAGTGSRFVDQGFISPVQLAVTDTPHLVPLANAPAPLYGIHQNGSLTVFNDFASWEAAVATGLAGGANARFLAAIGKYDAPSQTFSAGRAVIFLK